MKGLYEIIEEFKDSEESRALDEVNEATKKLLSRREVMEAMAEAAAGAIEAFFEEKNKSVAIIRAGLEVHKLSEKLFREEELAEKPAEKTELSALEKLLFEQTHLAEVRYEACHLEVQLARWLELCDLLEDAGLEEEYDAWKEEHGYE